SAAEFHRPVLRQVVAGPRNYQCRGASFAEALGSGTRTWPLPGPHQAHRGVPQVRKRPLALIPLSSEGRGRNLHCPSDPPPALAHSPSATEILNIDHPRPPPEPTPLGPRSGLAGPNRHTNSRAFLRSAPAQGRREEISHRAAGIEPWFLVAHHADSRRSQLPHVSGHGPDALSTEAVKRPH